MASKRREATNSPHRTQSPKRKTSPQSRSQTGGLYPNLSPAGDATISTSRSRRDGHRQDRETDLRGEEDQDVSWRSNSTLNETNMPDQYDSDWRSHDEVDSSFDEGTGMGNFPQSTTRSGVAYMVPPEPRRNIREGNTTPPYSTPATSPEAHVRSHGYPESSFQGVQMPSSYPLPATSDAGLRSRASKHEGYTPVVPDSEERRDVDNGSGFLQNNIIWIMLICILIVCLGCLAHMHMYKPKEIQEETTAVEISQRDEMVATFMRDLGAMRRSFPGQSTRFWSTLAATTKSVLKTEEPRQPGIILLAGGNSSMLTVKCIERELSYAITAAYEDSKSATRLPIEKRHLTIPHAELKLLIDDEFKGGLSTGSRVAILQNLHWVPGKAAMMFHAYCDNESAPFKDAIIVFTFQLDLSDDKLTGMTDIQISRAVEQQLQNKWEQEIGEDNTMALLSRVANNVAVVRDESMEVLKSNGCKV